MLLRWIRLWAVFAVAVGMLCSAHAAWAQPKPDPPAEDAEAKRARAKEHFDRGLSFYEQSAWEPALAEFLASRAQFPTRSATKNAALCLKNLGRHDEALEMFELLLREFPDLPEADRTFANRSVTELLQLVGTIELRGVPRGATVSIDARTWAPPAEGERYLARVSAGPRVVRVHKEGFAPFEARTLVLAGKTHVVEVKLSPVGRAGRLSVSERSGKRLDVVIDGVVVGKTPWEGAVAPGQHSVHLRGSGIEGSQPAVVSVRVNQNRPVELDAEELPSAVRVEPRPATAHVSIDGVPVGVGTWEGRLRAGEHRVDVEADGYLPATYRIELGEREQELVTADLRRAGQPPAESEEPRANRVLVEAIASAALTSSFGGVTEGGGDIGAGVVGMAHLGYELRSGLCFGLMAGGLWLSQTRDDRSYTVTPTGEVPDQGSVDHDLSLSGVLVGAWAGLHLGERFPGLFRLGLGGLFGSVHDRRRGVFVSDTDATYDSGTLEDSSGASFVFIAPEARIGFRFAEHFEASAGVAAVILVAVGRAEWDNDDLFLTDAGGANFANEELTGGAMVLLTPGLGLRYDF